jgi:hypothetical protein
MWISVFPYLLPDPLFVSIVPSYSILSPSVKTASRLISNGFDFGRQKITVLVAVHYILCFRTILRVRVGTPLKQ